MNIFKRTFHVVFGYGEHMRRNVWAVMCVAMTFVLVFAMPWIGWKDPTGPIILLLWVVCETERHLVCRKPFESADAWVLTFIASICGMLAMIQFRPERPGLFFWLSQIACVIIAGISFFKWNSLSDWGEW